MGNAVSKFSARIAAEPPPVLHLSGPRLGESLRRLVEAAEPLGGIERLVGAVKLKATLFQEALADGGAAALNPETLAQLCAFMPTCRRRIGGAVDALGFEHILEAVTALLDGAADTATADARVAAFMQRFPQDRAHRFVRDLASELLHHALPEQYPQMTRWVWDARTNTGVLREIWYDERVDSITIDIPDSYDTFLTLRQELSQFLSDNGVFRDMMFYVDALEAQVYADYIEAQGGTYLRADFVSALDPLAHVRRMLGLDGLDLGAARRGPRIVTAATAGRAS